MKQLSLFDEGLAEGPLSSLEGLPELSSSPELQLQLQAAQLSLFDRRAIQLVSVGEALAAGEIDEAERRILASQASHPDDLPLRSLALDIAAHRAGLQRAESLAPPARASALLALAQSLVARSGAWTFLRARLLRRVAQETHALLGDEGELEGQPAGYYLIEAGAFAEAKASLAAAVRVRRAARPLFLLADAATSLGEPSARRTYLEALLVNPFDAAFASVRDPEVRALPDVARYEFEIEEVPEAWSAPVGILTDVLPSPAVLDASVYSAREEDRAGGELCLKRREALACARRFVEAFAVALGVSRATEGSVLEARRAMKQLCPTLFTAYLRRVTGR
jgi:hypothetical protein